MTFDDFRADFFKFLEKSTVNLGRKTAKTRQAFIDIANNKFDQYVDPDNDIDDKKESNKDQMHSSVMCIKPKDKRRALDIGKGVHAMTASESLRADQDLGRSPYSSKQKKEGRKDDS